MGKSGSRITVAVGIPSGGDWKPAFGMSLVKMVEHFNRVRLGGASETRLMYLNSRGSMLVQNRQNILTRALKAKADALLFLDDDMVFPKETLHRLWQHGKEFVAAAGCTKEKEAQCVAFVPNGPADRKRVVRKDLEEAQGKPIRVSSVGLACALIRLNGQTIRRIMPPHFSMEWIWQERAYCGEDVFFCAKWENEGGEIWVDPKLSMELGHIGMKTYEMS